MTFRRKGNKRRTLLKIIKNNISCITFVVNNIFVVIMKKVTTKLLM